MVVYYTNKKSKEFNNKLNEFNKKFITSGGSGIKLTSNEINDIIKVIRAFENRGVILKETAKKINS